MNNEDMTVWLKPPTPVIVRVERGNVTQTELRFTDTFRIGRDKGCSLQIKDSAVSRFHLEVVFDGTQWWLHDIESANGTYLDGNRIQKSPLPQNARVELGKGGPALWLSIEVAGEEHIIPLPVTKETTLSANTDAVSATTATSISTPTATTTAASIPTVVEPTTPQPETPAAIPASSVKVSPSSDTEVMQKYFSKSVPDDAGEHTIMIRRAFQHTSKKQSKKYMIIIGVAVLLLLGAGGLVIYQHIKISNMRQMSAEIFYNMKALELQIAQIEMVVLATANPKQQAEMASKRGQLEEMKKNYDKFLEDIGIYGKKMSEEEKAIFKVARIFGECEVNMPEDFVHEVQKYIGKWRSTNRLTDAVKRAKANGYVPRITDEMLYNHMPPQFFYLALQESGFNERAVGPVTRFGIAKGMWQFIPQTAVEYGLITGPLIEIESYDPHDERHNFDSATRAASRYIKDIYNTEAQASGLLVMASYNWGAGNVRQVIRRMPENPRERNFWQLLKQHKIPQETYDYVFYIFSAAVIGENPRLFGFDFDNPLI